MADAAARGAARLDPVDGGRYPRRTPARIALVGRQTGRTRHSTWCVDPGEPLPERGAQTLRKRRAGLIFLTWENDREHQHASAVCRPQAAGRLRTAHALVRRLRY